MAPRTRLSKASPLIIKTLRDLGRIVLDEKEILGLFQQNRENWNLANHTTEAEFISWIIDHTDLRIRRVLFDPGKVLVKFTRKEADEFDLGLSLLGMKAGYLGYFSAMTVHGLTETKSKVVYICVEESSVRPSGVPLTQSMIDDSYSKPPRVSNKIGTLGHQLEFCLVASQNGQVGIEFMRRTDFLNAPARRVTSLERTLIDIVVRPHYAGGIFEVLEAFRHARGRMSANRIRDMLPVLGYRTPFHQAIGFYMERAGYPKKSLELLAKLPRTLDLPLAHGLDRTNYSSRWRVWYPKGF